MANIKFSQFSQSTDVANVDFVVGYDGATNVRISPADLVATAGPFLPLAGGTMTGDTIITDNIAVLFGTGGDSFIKHTGTDMSIYNDVGNINIVNRADDKDIIFQSDNGSGGVTTYFKLWGLISSLAVYKDMLFVNDGDGGKLKFGASQDLQIYHDGSDSYLDNQTGNLFIVNKADDKNIIFQSDDGSGGIATYFTVDGANEVTSFQKDSKHEDNIKAYFGNASDLQIYHDGDNSYIKETGTGTLNLQGSTQVLISGTNGEVGVQYVENAGVGLRHNNVTKLTTESTGINVTGKINLSDGQNNVLIGTSAGANITTGSSNTLIGDVAGDALTTGNNNVTLGYSSLSAETAGDRSVAIGNFALQVQNNTINTDAYNTAVGYAAGASVTTAQKNTLIGGLAGDAMTTGGDNVAVGYSALSSQTVANTNVAIGVSAMATNVAADRNVAVGHEALLRMTSASSADHYNVALGYNAGREVTTGTKNTILGGLAGDAMNTGVDNVALGYKALSADQGGARSTAIGSNALASQVVASSGNMYNTALGFGAGQSVTGASQNTFIGALAGGSATSGTNNTVIGALAEKSAITAANEITLGNSSIATLRCQVTSITALSDERDKTSIEDLPYGLDFVNSLQPKKFVWDHRAETRVETDEEGNETQVEFYSSNKGKKDIGFIAQELQSVDNEFTQLVYNSNPEKLQATYGRLVPVLVKAIQDLSAKVTALENA
jgi:hypothetical protein